MTQFARIRGKRRISIHHAICLFRVHRACH